MALQMKFIGAILVALSTTAISASTPPVARPPITGIATVTVYTAHPAQSKHFYEKILGFQNRADSVGSSYGKSPNIGAVLYPVNKAQSIEVDASPAGETDFLASISFRTTDVKALYRYLLSKSVPVPDGVQKSSDGSSYLWTKDPEGHRIQFIGTSMRIFSACPKCAPMQISHHILHAGFIVHNRDAEDKFFRDILGFRLAWQGGMKDGKTDWVDMQVPNGSDWLEYMLHSAAAPSARESGVLNHFALGVSSIRQAADELQQRDNQLSQREKPQIGRDGKWQLNLYDPDGTRVELMEFLPVQTPCCSAYSLPSPETGRKF